MKYNTMLNKCLGIARLLLIGSLVICLCDRNVGAGEPSREDVLEKPLDLTLITVSQEVQKDDGQVSFKILNKQPHRIGLSVKLEVLHDQKWGEIYSDLFEEETPMVVMMYIFPKNAEIKGSYDPQKVLKLLKIDHAEFRVRLKGMKPDEVILSDPISISSN